MQLTLKDFTRHQGGSPGDHLVASIQQMGDGKTTNDTTDIIIDTDQEQRDIRIVDGDQVLKVQLGPDYSINRILQNDVAVSNKGNVSGAGNQQSE